MTTHPAPATDEPNREGEGNGDGSGQALVTQSPQRVSAGYRIRIGSHLDDHWSAWFGEVTLTRESGGTTSLSGIVPDQAALYGLLAKVRDLGITLISVETIDPAQQPSSSRWPGKHARRED